MDHIHDGVSNGNGNALRLSEIPTTLNYAKRDTSNTKSVMINRPNRSKPDVTLNTLVMLSRIALTFLTQKGKLSIPLT